MIVCVRTLGLLRCAWRGHGVGVDDSTVIEVWRGTRRACVLAEAAAVSPPSLLSRHLETSRELSLITGQRRVRWSDYSLVFAAFEALSETLAPAASEPGLDGVGEVGPSWAFSSVS